MDATLQEVEKQVRVLTHSIQGINALLQEDEHFFKKNDVANIDASNAKKSALLSALQSSQQQLQSILTNHQDGKRVTLSEFIASYPVHVSKSATQAVEELKITLMTGYQHLINNNQVIIGNLSFIKEFWDKLAQLSQGQAGIYEKPSIR